MDDAGRGRCISYDNLVIATGAVPAHPPSDGLEQKGVLFLRTMGGGFAVRDYLVEQSPASAMVVGGGYIGLEIAEALNGRGVEVTLVEYLPSVLTKARSAPGTRSSWARRPESGTIKTAAEGNRSPKL